MKTLIYIFLLNGITCLNLLAQKSFNSVEFTRVLRTESIRFTPDSNKVCIPVVGQFNQRSNNSVLVWVQDPQTDEWVLLPKRLSDGNSLTSVVKIGKRNGTDTLLISRREWVTDTLNIMIKYLVLRRNLGNGAMRKDNLFAGVLLHEYFPKNPYIVPKTPQ